MIVIFTTEAQRHRDFMSYFSAFQLRRYNEPGLTVRPESFDGTQESRRRTHHERLNFTTSLLKLKAYFSLCLCVSVVNNFLHLILMPDSLVSATH